MIQTYQLAIHDIESKGLKKKKSVKDLLSNLICFQI